MEILAIAIKQEKEETKLSLFTYDMTMFIENTEKLQWENEFSNVAD